MNLEEAFWQILVLYIFNNDLIYPIFHHIDETASRDIYDIAMHFLTLSMFYMMLTDLLYNF